MDLERLALMIMRDTDAGEVLNHVCVPLMTRQLGIGQESQLEVTHQTQETMKSLGPY